MDVLLLPYNETMISYKVLFLLLIPCISAITVSNTCGEPPPAVNAYRSFPDGDTVVYKCVDNFHLDKGNLTRTCREGKYTGDMPVCVLSCGPPLNTSYADLQYESTGPGAEVTYVCPNGSLVDSTVTQCDYRQERWLEGDRCYPDIPLDRQLFVTKATSVANGSDVTFSSAETRTTGTKTSTLLTDLKMFGPDNILQEVANNSLFSGECASTAAERFPKLTVTLDDAYDIYQVIVTFPNDTIDFLPAIIRVASRYNSTFSSYGCAKIPAGTAVGMPVTAMCSPRRYGNYGKEIFLTGVFDPMHGMLQVCDFQIYGRPLRYIDCGQPPQIPYAQIVSLPRSTRQGFDNIITYRCIEGFHIKKGKTHAYCSVNGAWATDLTCTDQDNILYGTPVRFESTTVNDITDGDPTTCYAPNNTVTDVIIVIDLEDKFEVEGATITFWSHIRKPRFTMTVADERNISQLCGSDTPNYILEEAYNGYIECPVNPVGIQVTIRVKFGLPSLLEFCEIRVYGRPFTEALECSRKSRQRDYKGTLNMTAHGIPCQRWDSYSPHKHSDDDVTRFPDATLADAANYCRNPGGVKTRVWCFTQDPNVAWQYCVMHQCNYICLLQDDGRSYKGGFSRSASGKSCANFLNSNLPRLSRKLVKNSLGRVCRNPYLSQNRPWCFTDNTGTLYEQCHLPSCPTTSDLTHGYWKIHENQTLGEIIPAEECFTWKQDPEDDKLYRNRHELSNKFPQNVCRSTSPVVFNMTILCRKNNLNGFQWIRGIMECVNCGIPPDVQNATYFYQDTLIYNAAFYTCVDGYAHSNGSDEITCLPSGQWEISSMVCERSCGPPPLVSNTNIEINNTLVNSTAVYICQTGFSQVSGSAEIVCTDNNTTWENPDIVCEVDCGSHPPPVPDASVVIWGSILDDIAVYVCLEQFEHTSGSNVSTCQENGTWSTVDMVCAAITHTEEITASSTALSTSSVGYDTTVSAMSSSNGDVTTSSTAAVTILSTAATSTPTKGVSTSASTPTSTVIYFNVTKSGELYNVCLCRCLVTRRNQKRLLVDLALNRKALSAYRNKKISISDSRPLSVGMGCFSVTIITIILAVFVASDLLNIGLKQKRMF